MSDLIGSTMSKYSLLKLLGRGDGTTVYLGEDDFIKTQIAIKVLNPSVTSTRKEIFLESARAMAHLTSPHIVRSYEFGFQDNYTFFVMSYAPHGSLRQRYPRGSQLPLAATVIYVKQIAEALHHAHTRNILHQDLKPENVLLGANETVLVSDFGFSVKSSFPYVLGSTESFSSICYLAPEQLMGKPQQVSDQYALGIMIYEWLCGVPPFLGTVEEVIAQHLNASPVPLAERIPHLPPSVNEVVHIALAKDPQSRFTSIKSFAHAFEQASFDQEQKP
jgi:serine/threonine protein kinase